MNLSLIYYAAILLQILTFYSLVLRRLHHMLYTLQIPLNKKNKKERYQEELEERIVSLIASLFGKQASKIVYIFFTVCVYLSNLLLLGCTQDIPSTYMVVFPTSSVGFDTISNFCIYSAYKHGWHQLFFLNGKINLLRKLG